MSDSSRFQNGSLSRVKNKTREDSWLFRYYEQVDGKRVHRNLRIGGVKEFPNRKTAESAVLALRERINAGVRAPETVRELAAHYKQHELTTDRKAHSTVAVHTVFIDTYIVPKWGPLRLTEVRTVQVEGWLDSLAKAPGTRAKIRNIFSAMYSHALRHEWVQRNPITQVRTSAKRLREPDVVTPQEFQALLQELKGAARLMVFLAGATGLRRGELLALRWCDVDFLSAEVRVIRSCVRNVIGNAKTAASKKPIPLHGDAIRELSAWRAETTYKADEDFVFASTRMEGKQPLTPDMVLKKTVRPAFTRAVNRLHADGDGTATVPKVLGWHTFRHSLATNLRSLGVDVKVAQELLRHANSRITLDIYTQAISPEKRKASTRALDLMLGSSSTPAEASVPSSTVKM